MSPKGSTPIQDPFARARSLELDDLLNSADPDIDRAKALQKEINDLRASMDEKRLSYELEARKVIPDGRIGRGYGRGCGDHMRGYGPGMGTSRDMGPGFCRK